MNHQGSCNGRVLDVHKKMFYPWGDFFPHSDKLCNSPVYWYSHVVNDGTKKHGSTKFSKTDIRQKRVFNSVCKIYCL